MAINKRFEVQINKDNKIALKKKAVLNTRFNVDLQGTKTNNTHSYTLNLRPGDLKLASFTGRFYKLTKDSQYQEVTKFSVEQHQADECTTDNFMTSVGVQLCLSIRRPKVGSVKNLIWPEQNPIEASIEDDEDENDDDDDDKDVDKNIRRPRLTLSGPYSYEVGVLFFV